MKKMEFTAPKDKFEAGREVLFDSPKGNDRYTPADWVAGDFRREWGDTSGGTGLVWAMDKSMSAQPGSADAAEYERAVHSSMDAWNKVPCATIPLMERELDPSQDVGIVKYLLGYGGSMEPVADIFIGGFMPLTFFDVVSEGTLGTVTRKHIC